MNISVIGSGYVGLVTGTIFSELGNRVTCIDIDQKKIDLLNSGVSPIYEPGLEELIHKNQQAGRLQFTTDLEKSVAESPVIFIAVGTPSDKDGQADLTFVKTVAENIGKALAKNQKPLDYYVVVNKSTVPVGTGDLVSNIIKKEYKGRFDVVSNPEFLREGSAVQDCLQPDRIVIGNGNEQSRKVMTELYHPLDCPILFTDVKSAEMIKYASNAFLATSISFINSIAAICESVGADVEKVAHGMKFDKRIGKHAFLAAGCGYGGSCFPKDIKALIRIAKNHNHQPKILEAVEEINEEQKQSMVKKLRAILGNDLTGKTIALWGLTFKPRTDDMRDSVAISVVNELASAGARIKAFDPVAEKEARKIFAGQDIEYSKEPFECARDVEGLLVLTAWDEFRQINLDDLKKIMKQPAVIDGRNIFEPAIMKEKGFNYLSIGR